MDIATILGIVIAWGALVIAVILEGGSFGSLVNTPAFVLVVFGTIGAAIAGTSIKTLFSLPAIVRSAFKGTVMNPPELIRTMVGFARKARREGVLSLEVAVQEVDNEFLRKGVMLVVDGTPSVMLREILETEVIGMQERHKVGETFFSSLGGFSPTLGIIGTVIGLINMLAKLSEPGEMGHAIATAFVATLYGVMFANLVYLPIAGKLRTNTAEEVVACEMIIEGVLSIQAGDNARIVETRMMAFLPPAIRDKIEADRPTAAAHEEALAA
ncbi:MAG: flagellar motor protein [Armatimonadetes bacterium]|jgi:chemotaxis protein MotA|nr:flagellar motor protein [Armatimonadota bacterium]